MVPCESQVIGRGRLVLTAGPLLVAAILLLSDAASSRSAEEMPSPKTLAGVQTIAAATADYPTQPVKVIVPFAAGGGSDTFVRILQQAIEAQGILRQPLVVINVPGAGGSIGSRRVLQAEPDGYTFLCLHEAMITAKYAGVVDYGPEAFVPVAGTGEVGAVVAVAADAPFPDLPGLLDAASHRPVIFSANIGAPSHFTGLMLENAQPGAHFRYTQTGGGAKRFAALAGGHIDVSAFSIAEYLQFRSAGLRGLAFCGPSRHPAAPELPTAREQGFDVISSNMHFWWAPPGTPPARTEFFANVLAQAIESPQVRKRLAAIHTDPVLLTGPPLQRSLAERESRIARVAQRETFELPDFPRLLLVIVALLGGWIRVQSWMRRTPAPPMSRRPRRKPESGESARPRRGLALAVFALTAAYVAAMQTGWIGFRIATALYILAFGVMLTGRQLSRWPALAAVALLMSVGVHALFTRLFVIDLP